MRAAFSYTGILSASLFVAFSSFASSEHPNNPSNFNSKIAYDLSNAPRIKGSNGQFYIQAAKFKNIKNANNYKQQLKKKTPHPVTVKARGQHAVVIIGPLNSAEVKALSRSPSHLKTKAGLINPRASQNRGLK